MERKEINAEKYGNHHCDELLPKFVIYWKYLGVIKNREKAGREKINEKLRKEVENQVTKRFLVMSNKQ